MHGLKRAEAAVYPVPPLLDFKDRAGFRNTIANSETPPPERTGLTGFCCRRGLRPPMG